MELAINIEGVLFYKGTPIKKTTLCKLFDVSEEVLQIALTELKERLLQGAMRLSETTSEVQMVTAPELDELIEAVRKDEMRRDIGKAGAETLAIILYKAPITRAEIDRIRGVNSSFILRNLLVRGLIEREAEKNSGLFSPTTLLLSHLGITNRTELPNYPAILDALEVFEAEQADEESNV